MAKIPRSERKSHESSDWQERQVSLGGAIIGAAITLTLGVFVGLNWNTLVGQFLPYLGFQSTTQHDWSALDEVYSALEQNYDGDIDQSAIIDGAKKGLVAAIGDQYTEYMTASEAEEFQKSLHGEVGAGIGIEMAKRGDYIRVTRTLPDNPARAAGVLAGDIIYKIDGEEVYTLSSEKIAGKLRGDAGTSVQLTVVRDGEEKTFDLTREEINNVSAYINYDGDLAVITVTRFDNDTGTLVQSFADEFEDKGVNKVILDLRGNGGGYVNAAKDLLSLWLDGEKVVTQKSSKSGENITYADRGKAKLTNTPTIVLVNGSTASASEITAGALQDYDKATILGEKTYGKGVVQVMKNLSLGTMLKVTSAHWYTPNDLSINQTGITPDIEVEKSYEDTNAGRDPQLDAAKQELNK